MRRLVISCGDGRVAQTHSDVGQAARTWLVVNHWVTCEYHNSPPCHVAAISLDASKTLCATLYARILISAGWFLHPTNAS